VKQLETLNRNVTRVFYNNENTAQNNTTHREKVLLFQTARIDCSERIYMVMLTVTVTINAKKLQFIHNINGDRSKTAKS